MFKRLQFALRGLWRAMDLPKDTIRSNDSPDQIIHRWRAAMLDRFLVISMVVSLPSLLGVFQHAFAGEPLHDPYLYAALAAEALIVTALLLRRYLPHTLRVSAMLLALLVMSLPTLAYMGLRSIVVGYAMILTVIPLILLGKRAGILAAGVVAGLLFSYTSLLDQKLIGLLPYDDAVLPSMWTSLAAVLMLLGIGLALQVLFYRLLEEIIERERSIKAELVQTQLLLEDQNAGLEEKIEEHTQALQQSNRVLTALVQIADAVNETHDPQQFFQRIHQIIGGLIEARNLLIALYDEASGLLSFPYYVDEKDPAPTPEPLENSRGLVSYIIRTGSSIRGGAQAYAALLNSQAVQVEGTPSQDRIGAPLFMDHKVIGAVLVQSYGGARGYTARDEEVLDSVSRHIAAALLRFQALEAERRSEERYRLIAENIDDVIWTSDTAGRITYISPSVRKQLGLEPAEVLSAGLAGRYTPDSLDNLASAYDRSARELQQGGEGSLRIEVEEYRKDGSTLWVEIARRPLRDAAGQLAGFVGVSRDISTRRQMETELRESNEMLRLIFENAFDGISIYEEFPEDDSRLLIDCNERYCQMAGRSKAELLAVRDTRVFQRKGDQPALPVNSSAVLLQQAYNGVFSWVRPDGRENIIEFNAAPTLVGGRFFTVGLDRDMTERRRAEADLRESNEKLRLIFENAFDGISIYEEMPAEDRRVLLDCNERYCQIAGRSKEELLAAGDTRIFQHPIEYALSDSRPVSAIVQLAQAQQAFSGIFAWNRPDGRENIIEYNAAPAWVGERYFTIGLDRDVTEREHAESVRRAAEQRLADIIDFLPLATMVIDQDRRVTAWNHAMEEITGVKKEEIIGQGDYAYAVPFYGERMPILIDLVFLPDLELDSRYQHVRRQEGILTAESFCQRLGDHGRTLIGFASPLYGPDGQLQGAIESIEDITEIRAAEKALQAAKEAAEAANRSKSTFLASMSHEIRTPMNAILGFTQLMQRDSELTPRQREHLSTISRSGEHLLALINDILELSKIEAGRSTLNLANFDLHRLLADLEMMFRVRTDEKKLRLLLDMATDLPQWVVCDEGKLRQVLINLIGNAVKFTSEGGVGVRARLEVGERPALHFEVEDTGPGIAPEEQAKLFQPFEQASSGVKMGGTGLGLALSQGFVQLMGGQIHVSSTPGKGSLFSFTIPCQAGQAQAARAEAGPARVTGLQPGQGEIRVLIADDRETNRQILTQMLAPLGFKTLEVVNGAEALRASQVWKPRVVLMDMRMPVMDGYEATRRIKTSPTGGDTLVIAVTASAFQEDREAILAAGADGYISKPFKEGELFDVIGRLAGVRYLSEAGAPAAPAAALPAARETLDWAAEVAALPPQLVRGCREAAETADIFPLLECIEQITRLNPLVGRKLADLANRYAYEDLVNLLTQGSAG